MGPSTTAFVPRTEAQPSTRPSWAWTTAWLLGGAFLSAIPVRLALAGMADRQLLPGHGWQTRGWPWPTAGTWALAADAGFGLLFGFALAALMRLVVRLRSDGWDLRLWPVALATALATAAETTVAGVTAFALMVVVTRELAIRPRASVTLRPALKAAIAGGVALSLVATFSYQPLHPLLAAFPDRGNKLMEHTLDPLSPPSGRELAFVLENAGMGTATLRSITVVGPNAGLLDIETHGRRLRGARIPRDADLHGRVRLSKAACATDAAGLRVPSASIDALVVRVETLGTVRTQRFDVKPSADLFCGSAR